MFSADPPEGVSVRFWGVRGSCPCPSEATRRYGGNTACVVLSRDGEAPIVLDLGTGLARYGESWSSSQAPFRGTALLTHMHWDHVQGLPFFAPLDLPGAGLDIYGPDPGGGLEAAFRGLMKPPYFPITPDGLQGRIRFHHCPAGTFGVDEARITSATVPHTGPTLGYRIDWGGVVIAYVSDHQAPESLDECDAGVLELCNQADLVIHDAQYTETEFRNKSHWGHSTPEYAVTLAARSGARTLALFHHDPLHDDRTMDAILATAQATSLRMDGPRVVAAAEGAVYQVTAGARPAGATREEA